MTSLSEREIVLCLDQGTTNTKAVAINADGQIVAQASEQTDLTFPRAGWAESDAVALWEATARSSTRCLALLDRPHVVAVGVANQRESAVVWERATGTPLGPVVSWQCRRSQPLCDELRRIDDGQRIRELSGLHLSPMFSAGKMAWLLDHVPNGLERATRGEICVGTVDSWILWNLTGGSAFATDLTNASRTQLLDLATLQWSDELMDLFGIPLAALPAPTPSGAEYGACTLIGAIGSPVCAMAGDAHASLVAHGALAPGAVKATFGTGTSVLAPVSGYVPTATLSQTIGWSRQTDTGVQVVNALEGNIYATGAALDFAATFVGIVDVGDLEQSATPDRGSATGVFFVPALSGLGAPYWDASATGAIVGLTRGSTSADLARAAFESVAFQVRDVLEELPHLTDAKHLHVDGGAMRSDVLAALVADVTGMTVVRPTETDLTAVGVGYLAGLQVGLWSDLDDLDRLRAPVTSFESSPDRDWNTTYERWHEAVGRSLGWSVGPEVEVLDAHRPRETTGAKL